MSLSKNELKDIKSLGTKKGRKAQKSYLAEGIRVLEEAVRHRVRPDLVLWAPLAVSDRGQKLIKNFQMAGVPCDELTMRQIESIAPAKSPQPIIGRFALPVGSAGKLLDREARRVLLCDGISDPGNLGTLIRSALAFGFDRLLLIGESADPYSPKVVRSSSGSIFGVRLARSESGELKEILSAAEFNLIGSAVNAGDKAVGLDQRLIAGPLILAIGSEAVGLSAPILKQCDRYIRLEHSSSVESLNAAVAGSIIMKQIYDLAK